MWLWLRNTTNTFTLCNIKHRARIQSVLHKCCPSSQSSIQACVGHEVGLEGAGQVKVGLVS